MKKRNVSCWLALFVLLCGGLSWMGCSGTEPQEGVLDVWVTWAEDEGPLQTLLAQYSETGGVPVKVTTGFSMDKVQRALSGEAVPDLVVLSGSGPVKSWYSRDLLSPLDAWIASEGIEIDDFYPAALAQCETSRGVTLCLPWTSDVYALYWNKELFRAVGLDPERPPRTMDELVELADRLTLRGGEGKLTQVGFVPDLTRSHSELYARMLDGAWGSVEGVNSQAMVDALNWQRQFYDRYGTEELVAFVSSANRYVNSRHPVLSGQRASCQQCHRELPAKSHSPMHGFYTGQVAMTVAGQWPVGSNDLSRIPADLDYGVAPFPPPAGHPERANTTLVQGAVIVIPAQARDAGSAAGLLAWMMSPEVMAEVAHTHASLPARRAAVVDPRFQEVPGLGVFLDLLGHPNAAGSIATSLSPELNAALGQVEDQVLRHSGDPVSLLDGLRAEFERELREALVLQSGP
jgi:multiple sugar transport system substrate-binding protein